MRICEYCHKEYEPTAFHQRFCSPVCRGRKRYRNGGICVRCGGDIPEGRKGVYCSEACKAAKTKDLELLNERREPLTQEQKDKIFKAQKVLHEYWKTGWGMNQNGPARTTWE